MTSWLKERISSKKNIAMVGSPTREEKAVIAITEDNNQRTGLALGRMAENLHNEEELVKYLHKLRESDVLAEVAKLEEENRFFNGFSELYDMPPTGLRTQWNPGSYSIVYSGHSYLSRRLEALNSIKDNTKAVLVIGSSYEWEKFQTQGYPTPTQFTTVFDRSYVFFSADDYKEVDLPCWKGNESFVNYLDDLFGSTSYKNRVIMIVDDKEKVLKTFTWLAENGKRQISGSVRLEDKQYKAEPEKVLVVLEPPDEKELSLLDAFVVAYGGKLLRAGYFLGSKGGVPDHDGMSDFIEAAYGIKREWRPHFTHKNREKDSSLPDVSLHAVEGAARALHMVNRLTEVFQEYELI